MINWNKIHLDDKDTLPEPDDLDDSCSPYYLIYTKYGASLAMYLMNDEGECNWYKDYQSIVVGKVTAWSSINKP